MTDARASARTVIVSVFPKYAAGNNLPIIMPANDIPAVNSACLLANLSSIILDYCARMKLGGLHLNYFLLKQLPVLKPSEYSDTDRAFITQRVLELTYTNVELNDWSRDLNYVGEPFSFDPDRRAILQSELDAYFAKLYGLSREELQFVLDPQTVKPGYPSETFAVLKRNEEREFGEYRTQRLVLEAWDKLDLGELH